MPPRVRSSRSATRGGRRTSPPAAASPTATRAGWASRGRAAARARRRRPGGSGRRWSSGGCRRGSCRCRPAGPAGRSTARRWCASSVDVQGRGAAQAAAAHDEVVVDAAGVDHLRVLGAQRRTDPGCAPEVEGGAGDRAVAAGRDAGPVDRGDVVGLDEQLVAVDRPGALAVEVEVGVVGQVDHGGGVGGRLQGDPDGLPLHLVADPGAHGAREPLVAVRAHQRQHQLVGVVRLDVPQSYVEPLGPAVQAVAPVVGAHLDVLAVEREAAAGDAVGVPPDDSADVVPARQPLRDVRMSEHDVAPLAVAARHGEPVDGRAEGEDLDHGPGLGADRQEAHVASVGHLAEELVLRGVLAHGNILRHCGRGRPWHCWETRGTPPRVGAQSERDLPGIARRRSIVRS